MNKSAIQAEPLDSDQAGCGLFLTYPRRIKGLVGKTQIAFERNAGGVFSLLAPEEEVALIRVASRMELVGPRGEKLSVRQEADGNPDFYFLEEGSQRIGLRVLYGLYDQNDVYHGDGYQEVWAYPNGDLFCSVAVRLTDEAAHSAVSSLWLEIQVAPSYEKATVGTESPLAVGAQDMRKGMQLQFGDSLPGRFVVAEGEDAPALSLYWVKEQGRVKAPIFPRGATGPPVYHRWPALYEQFVGKAIGWNQHETSVLELAEEKGQIVERLYWVKDAAVPVKGWFTTAGLFALSAAGPGEVEDRITAHQKPLDLQAQGAEFLGYDELEGCYLVRKTADPAKVVLPRDPLRRQARVRVFGLRGQGGVVVKVDGEHVVPNLVSDGGIVDDPLVPVQVKPHAPAQECVVALPLSAEQDHVLTVEERPGIQFAYQAAFQSLDQRRNWNLFSDKCGSRGSFEFSAGDGKARDICAWGSNNEAVTELALFWFKNCGHSPHDYLNQTRDLRILKNGPDEVQFYYRGTNLSDRAQSEFWVTVPFQADCFQMRMRCRFTVLETWLYDRNQFYDIFPHEGVYTEKWWYKKVLFLDKDGQVGVFDNLDWTKNENVFGEAEGKAFYAMYPSDRGNLLTLVKRISPPGHPVHIAVCGNYIDHHLDLQLGEPPIQPGSVFEVDYDLALYGNDTISREQLVDIGRRSLQAGGLLLPRR